MKLIALVAWSAGLLAAAPPESSLWLDVPFVRQTGRGCGQACVLMVARYWDEKLGRGDSIPELLGSEETSARRMEHLFTRAGFRVFAFKGELADLSRHLSRGRPLVVCLKEGNSLHYVVVAGVDAQHGVILVNDPARRKLLKLTQSSFEAAWKSSSNWTLLALPGEPSEP
jgi:ABC-type bacteriocin/lantibiotic exporter with double-glycine peptidase domain